MRRAEGLRVLFAALAIAFFALPLVLHTVGVKDYARENRTLSSSPRLSAGWDVFDQTARYLTDRLPLRADAVRANNWLYGEAFGTVPDYARTQSRDRALPFAERVRRKAASRSRTTSASRAGVVQGSAGWLYADTDFKRPCATRPGFGRAIARWRAVAATIRASGRKAIVVVAPDKGSIYPEHFPDGPVKACGLRAKRQLRAQLSGHGASEGLADTASLLLRAKGRNPGQPLYPKTDTHWNDVGALVFANQVLDLLHVGIRISPTEVVIDKNVNILGDLREALGERTKESMAFREPVRPVGARVISGRTALIGDSFSDDPLRQLGFYFRRLRFTPMEQASRRRVLDAIVRSRRVVFEVVERDFVDRTRPGAAADAVFLRSLKNRLQNTGRKP